MGERNKKKDRKRETPKKTNELPNLLLANDQALANKQRHFCKAIIENLLDDESSLSFSKPVDELWDRDVLGDYFDTIKEPMDLGTVLETVSSNDGYSNRDTGLFDANAFRYQARLVFLNAIDYNSKGTDLARYAARFLNFLDTKLADLPVPSPSGDEHLSESPDPSKSAANDRNKLKEEDRAEKSEDEEDENGDIEEDDKDVPMDDPEAEKLQSQIDALSKKKALSEAALAEMELMKNVPLTFEENSKLRDEVETLPWEKAQKVAKILENYVQDALRESKEEDPEFVTLEFSTVEPRLLRDIEALIRPDPSAEKERKSIAAFDEEITANKRKLKALEQNSRKKPRRRR